MSLPYTYHDVAGMLDHTLLKPTLRDEQLERGIQTAIDYQTASVCIMPYYLRRCAHLLEATAIVPGTVIGFPHGASSPLVKLAEAEQALSDGGLELDMVINLSKALSGDWAYVRDEIKSITELAHQGQAKVKVIFENCYLEDEQKIRLCDLCAQANADWVKTSTGFGSGGASLDDLKLMSQHVPESVQVKAAGGIKTLDQLLDVREIGCSRVGASASQAILDQARQRLGLEPIHPSGEPLGAEKSNHYSS